MKIVGLITEYNPFHLGHKYHLDQSMIKTKSTHSIAVMSSSFVQRGEPALVDKWTRAKMAIDSGVDLVIELPFVFSVQSAELFAYGAIKILDSLNIVDCISFGSENGDLEYLRKAANILVNEPMVFKNKLKENLSKGMPFSASRSLALDYYSKSLDPKDIYDYANMLKESNNILGIEYLKALIRLNSPILPYTIGRVGNKYKDAEITTRMGSATGIRNRLLNDSHEIVKDYVPEVAFEYLMDFYQRYGKFNQLSNYDEILQYLFRIKGPKDLQDFMDMEIGLENRILRMALKNFDLNDLVKDVSTKRYPATRIKRILIHLLMNLKKNDIERIYDLPLEYIRVLATNKKGMEILQKISADSDVLIITKYSNYKKLRNENINLFLDFEEKATDLYFLGIHKNKSYEKMDYISSPYIKRWNIPTYKSIKYLLRNFKYLESIFHIVI